MKKTLLFSGVFLLFFLFIARGGWIPTDVRLDTGTSPGAYTSQNPQICSNGSNVYVVWQDSRIGHQDIYFNYSVDKGTTWQATEMRIDTGGSLSKSSSQLQITSIGNNVYVVWKDNRNGDYSGDDIYFNYSNDEGATWQVSDIRLDTGDSPGASDSEEPQLSSSGSNVYVVWHDDRNGGYGKEDIYFNNSIDGGATWQASDIRLNTGDAPGAHWARYPQISSSGNNVYAVWQDERNGDMDIYFNYSMNGGSTWQASDIRLDTGAPPGSHGSSYPQISSSGSNVYAVWAGWRNGTIDIYFNYSIDFGATWQPTDIRLDTGDPPGAYYSSLPQISSSGNNVYVVWYDERNGEPDIYFNFSTDGGVTWQASDTRLNTGDAQGAHWAGYPQISSSDNNVYAVWNDGRNGNPKDIYFNYSIDKGATWQSADFRLDTGDLPGAGGSWWPQISCTDNNFYVVWQDSRDIVSDIYFNTATLLLLDIKANGSDGPITITQGDALLVTVDLDAGIQTGDDADWWVLVKTSDPKPNNWYYFDMPTRSWMLGRAPTRQGSLFDVSSKKIPKTSGLAPGTYTFYFAVDMAMNGSIDVSQAYHDKVEVTIDP